MSGTLTGRRLAGTVSFTIDGDTWDVVGDCEYSAVSVLRETMGGQSRIEGFSVMPKACYISANLRDRADKAVFSLNQIEGSTITVQLANGKVVTGVQMWQVGEIGVRTQEASFPIRFESDLVIES